MTDFEVRRVANGWLMMPIRYRLSGDAMPHTEMYVFPSAAALSEFVLCHCESEENK